MLTTYQQVPSSIVFIIITPETVPPLQLTAPADCFWSEWIYIDRRRNVDKISSSGDKAQGPLSAAGLSAGAQLGGLGQQALQGWRDKHNIPFTEVRLILCSKLRIGLPHLKCSEQLTHLWCIWRVTEPQFLP